MVGALSLPDNIVQIGQNVNNFSMWPFRDEGRSCTSNGCPFRRTYVYVTVAGWSQILYIGLSPSYTKFFRLVLVEEETLAFLKRS